MIPAMLVITFQREKQRALIRRFVGRRLTDSVEADLPDRLGMVVQSLEAFRIYGALGIVPKGDA